MRLRDLSPIKFGRLSPRQAAQFGAAMTGGFGYLGAGPFLLVFNLPASLQKQDPPFQFRFPSIDELNRAIREATGNSPDA